MAQGVHGGLDVDVAPLGDEFVVGKDHKEIRQLAYQNDSQDNGQNLQRIAGLDRRRGGSDSRCAAGMLISGSTVVRDTGSVFCKAGAAALAAE